MYYEEDSFWGPDGIGAPGKKRIQRTIDLVPDEVNSLLDVGCGNGIFCNNLNRINKIKKIIGTDRSTSALRHVKTESVKSEINNLPFKDSEFDCVSSLQVLEHLPCNIYDKALSEIARVSNEYVIISVPIEEDITANYTRCPQCFTIFNSDLHLRSYTEKEITTLFDKFGFECIYHEKIMKDDISTGEIKYRNWRRSISHFRAPICPVCGFERQRKDVNKSNIHQKRNKHIFIEVKEIASKLLHFGLNKFTPINKKPYWIIAIYRKNKRS